MQEKALRIMDLALQLNSDRTWKDLSGNKPTVFVSFSGHICEMDVMLYTFGWDFDAKADVIFTFTLGTGMPEDIKAANACIEKMESLVASWAKKEKVDIPEPIDWHKGRPAPIEWPKKGGAQVD